MYSFNYSFLEKLIIESRESQKDLAVKIGLPEKFFSKLDKGGTNLGFNDICLLADFFDVDAADFFVSGNKTENFSKVKKGKTLFAKYYDYKEKYFTLYPPEPDSNFSSWVSDVHAQSSYVCGPVQSYIEKKNEYKRITEIYLIMENVLTSIVSSVDIDILRKEGFKNDLIDYLVYGIDAKSLIMGKRRFLKYANKACIELINQMEYKKLM